MATFHIKKSLVAALVATCMCGMAQAQDTNHTKSADKSFVADSAQDSLAEINFAKLALQKSQDKNIRDFATKMIRDHEMLITSMKPLPRSSTPRFPAGRR